MNDNSPLNSPSDSGFSRAVVIGGGIAGLTAARVLADHFARVTLVERDQLPDTPDFRRGVPQARHSHLLLSRGQAVLERLFPGLTAGLTAQGATVVDSEREQVETGDGAWYNDVPALICSRPLLEAALYQRLAAFRSVQVVSQYEVAALAVDRRGQRVTGVRLRPRHGAARETLLPAEVVIDTAGRGSAAPQWLADLGYEPPRETTVNAFSGYASRIYRRPANFDGAWKLLRIKSTPPHQTRSGMILPLEDDRWLVTLVGMAGDCPPTDPDGFLAFARSLPGPQVSAAIQQAEPLTPVYAFRGTHSQMRHYDTLPRYLDGLLVCGDAACALSPVYALGMTAAAIGSRTLGACLARQKRQGTLSGLTPSFQQQLQRDLAPFWRLVTESDRRWPATAVKLEQPSSRPRQMPRRERLVTIPLPLGHRAVI